MSKYARIKWLISAVVLTGFCHASHAQIKLVGLNPHAIPVDKNGAGSASITLQNQGPAAAPLRLSITDFVHLENGRALRIVWGHIDQGAEEFVASVADHEVVRAHPFANGRDHLDEHTVTRGMPLGVVHMLEPVDV